ncbi:FAD-binding monooxygenase ausC [Colletotrichum aenigma]|uniref:FAD-binding monooxygenase ausC n=1 Tax=Colletotrichum aenigma TaxID=1215731 RepID=UPI0018727EF7|nr:FAD-binding monooxygenase ausC [Colletotrichum aenigma]KAF5502661.1 FAD-binding monooxygenase ausC [Colletotrichum aenigma]
MTTTETTIRKYAEERAKRLAAVRAEEYASFRDDHKLHDLAGDPFIDYDNLEKGKPLKDGNEIRFLAIGAGISCVLFAHRLVKAGFQAQDFIAVDTAGGFGGTWYWNRYPGAMCDVEGYVYLPLLEETGYIPKHKYSYGSEIRQHLENVASTLKIRGMFGTTVQSQQWDEKAGRWIVSMMQNRGPNRDPVHMTDKVVGIIGSGATAIQVVPEVARWAKKLYVSQRTPTYVSERAQKETDRAKWASDVANKKGWQYERIDNLNRSLTNDPPEKDLCNDGWSECHAFAGIIGSPKPYAGTEEESLASLIETDRPCAERVRRHIEDQVNDKSVAEKLKPWYEVWCKRPAFHEEYLASFNRPNVELVDTDGQGIEGYTSEGVLANGAQAYPLDPLILTTGFQSLTFGDGSPSGQTGSTFIGRDRRDITEKWNGEEAGSLFGVATHGFPNLFFATFSNLGTSPNIASVYVNAADVVAHIISTATKNAPIPARTVIEVTREAEERYIQQMIERVGWTALSQGCTPGWFTGNAKLLKEGMGVSNLAWGTGIVDHRRMLDNWMAKGNLDGLIVTSAPE